MPCRFTGVRRPFRSRAVSFCSCVSVFVRACALIIIYAYVRTYGARTYNNARLVTPIDRSRALLNARLARVKTLPHNRSASFSCRFVAGFVSLARHGTERKLQLFIDWYCTRYHARVETSTSGRPRHASELGSRSTRIPALNGRPTSQR